MSNTWVIYLWVWDNPGKPGLIPRFERGVGKAGALFGGLAPEDEPAAHQLVGRVTAYQG